MSRNIGIPSLSSTLNMYTFFTLVFLALLILLVVQKSHSSRIPTINAYNWDFFNRRAIAEYQAHAKDLIAAGRLKARLFSPDIVPFRPDPTMQFGGPFQIVTPNGPRIILPASATEWVRTSKDLDHQELVREVKQA